MRPAITIIVELPQMQKLVDRAGICLKVSDQLLVVTAILERRKANLLVELHGLRHCADAERIGSQFIEGHRTLRFRAAAAALYKPTLTGSVSHLISLRPSSGGNDVAEQRRRADPHPDV